MADLLVRGLNDASPEVREVARRQFIGLYQHQLVTPRFLVKVLASADPESRADAAWQLGNGFAAPIPALRDTAAPETVEALRTAVRDPEPKVRIYAARALLGADPAARDTAAATLRDAMRVVDVELQVRAARVLWQATHAPPEVLDAYERGLTTGGKYVRFEAMDGIREMGPAAEPLRPSLERLNEDDDREVRHRAEVTLAALRPRQ
jgi:HEAT repeat protein